MAFDPRFLGLLEALKDDPADTVSRAALADWCEDHGDPARAEALRLGLSPEPTPEERDRLEALTKEHQPEWCRPLGKGFSPVYRSVGPLLRLATSADTLLRLPTRVLRGEAWPWVRELRIDFQPEQEAALAAWPGLATLRSLDLNRRGNSPWSGSGLLASPHAADLRDLGCSGNSRLAPEFLGHLGAAACVRRLRRLDLAGTHLPAAAVEALADLPLERLEFLNLWQLPAGDAALLRLTQGLRALCELDVRDTGITAASIATLAGWANLPSCRLLKLNTNNLSDDHLAPLFDALGRLPGPGVLHTFYLLDNDLGDATVERLAATPALGRLRSLTLGANPRIGPAGLQALARSPHLLGLRELFLAGTGGSDAGLVALASSSVLRGLERLSLGEGVGEAGAAALLAAAPLPRLRELDFDGNALREATREALREAFPFARISS